VTTSAPGGSGENTLGEIGHRKKNDALGGIRGAPHTRVAGKSQFNKTWRKNSGGNKTQKKKEAPGGGRRSTVALPETQQFDEGARRRGLNPAENPFVGKFRPGFDEKGSTGQGKVWATGGRKNRIVQ